MKKEIEKKIRWTDDEIRHIENIIEDAGVKAKRMEKNPQEDWVTIDEKKYDAFLLHKNYDWYDVANIIGIAIEQGKSSAIKEVLEMLNNLKWLDQRSNQNAYREIKELKAKLQEKTA